MICIHHNDLDGRCSAAIVNLKYGPKPGDMSMSENIEFISMDYKDTEDSLFMRNLIKTIGDKDVVIVDFSFKPEWMEVIRQRAREVVWIDHHVTAKDYPYYDLPGLRNFENKKFAGCELTWIYFFEGKVMPDSVRLIGDYDKWALLLPDSKIFYEGMKLMNQSPTSCIWKELLDPSYYAKKEEIIKEGIIAMQYRDNYCEELCNSFGFETELDEVKAYACNQYMFGSGGFGSKFQEYPMCLAFIFDGEKFTVSLYSETVHVGEIAKKYGGGGHKGAAGFVCEKLPFMYEEKNNG